MIARFQQFITLSLLMLAAVAVVLLCTAGHPWWALGALAVIALGHVAFLGIEFLLLALVVRRLPAWRADPQAMLRAWRGEALHAPRAFCWRQPFRSRVWPDILPNLRGQQRGVVLVHGLLCNRGFWNPWMAKLHATGTPVIAVNLEPIGGMIDGDFATVDAAVFAMTRSTGQPPLLVGHSRGGLVLRAWAAAPGHLGRIHRIITIGTPHGGTWMARFALSRSNADMRLDSPWLANLRARETAETPTRFTCFFSRCDNIVFPAPTATLAGADNREIAANAHIQMAFAPEVFAEVRRCLGDDATCTSGGAQARDQNCLSPSIKASGANSADAATRR